MPSELKKPEPFGYVSDFKQAGIMSFQHAPWDQTHSLCHSTSAVYTATQLEQYAADRVLESLERAAQAVLARARNASGSDFPDERDFANAVLALKEQTK
ncbi:hypothetical protein [Xenophilus sp.]|uniref:hypothetical protein n=1 Tax=Xenophilus sp. TaxID=1873499 RepID=UPI0037DCEB2E